jgi:hypothetical protein
MRDERLSHFNLVGGTALSLYMGHRKSVDLDLFSRQNFDVLELEQYLIKTYDFHVQDTRKKSSNTLIGTIRGIKVDCIKKDYPHVKPVVIHDDIRLCSTQDIAAMKLTAISQDGTRLKDFVDIAFLSSIMSLNTMLEAFDIKYPNTNRITAVKGLNYFDDIDFTVKIEMMAGEYEWEMIVRRLQEMIKEPDKIFSLNPLYSARVTKKSCKSNDQQINVI